VKASDLYNTTFTSVVYGRTKIRPAITAKVARNIFEAAKLKMNTNAPCKINPSLTNQKCYDVLSAAITPEMADETVLHSLISRNIVRAFGRFL
jgi:hypothetical protein